MILWIFLWIILIIPVIFLPIMGSVNYVYRPAPGWYVWVVGICLFILVLSMVIVFSERQACADMLAEYHYMESIIPQVYGKENSERSIQGNVIKINTQLRYYQHRSHQFGILSPYQYELKKLSLLQLKYFDTTNIIPLY